MAKAGAIDEPNDIFYLHVEEVWVGLTVLL